MAHGGWPADWNDRLRGKDCPLCAALGRGDSAVSVAVAQLAFSEVFLERRSRLPGYCVVVWRDGHVAEPTELSEDAAAGYWRDVVRVGRAVEHHFSPVKMNYMTLGNWVPHLHTHVVPRYPDDPALGGPIAYEAIASEEPIADQTLRRQADHLRRLLERGGGE
jgi:diadenosine tetraphosphate (Ap4A) HIT family hydrolase